MPRFQTAIALLLAGLITTGGCFSLPRRGRDGTRAAFLPSPVALDTMQDSSEALPQTVGTVAKNLTQSRQLPHTKNSNPLPASSAVGGDRRMDMPPAAQAGSVAPRQTDAAATVGASLPELTAFIRELEQSPSLDPVMRGEIIATACQTPPELQSQVIRQYRALLAMNATAAAPMAPTPPRPAATPDMFYKSPAPETVVPTAHTEPIGAEKATAAPEPKAEPNLREELDALRRLIDSKEKREAEPAAHTTPSTQDDDRAPLPPSRGTSNAGNDAASWEELVETAIERLEKDIDRRIDSKHGPEDEARLRLLHLIAGNRDDAVRAIESLEPRMQEFWSKEIFGLATLMSPNLIADRSNRLIESKRNLNEALSRLGESAPLFVRNLAFVTDVQSYGAYTPFDDYEFRPGQPVLLYAEVDNYRAKETARGYHTALRSSYEIFDSRRQKVADHEFNTNEEYCRNPRRDFFTVCEFSMPDKLYPGKYELRLTVADLNGDKAGESTITFQVEEAGSSR